MIEQGTHIDLFSGIGGFALAARWTGFRTVAFCECEPYAQRVLRKHWPDVPIYDDVRTFPGERYTGAALLTGGFPCQPFSLAGKRAGAEDDRFLWPAMVAVVEAARPTWIIGENVPGIVSMELDRCIDDLEARGYACWPVVIPACSVGARHRRDRVWIVAHADTPRLPQQFRQEEKREGTGLDWMGVPNQWGFRDKAEIFLARGVPGIPGRVDAVRGLGNAIVPQVAAEIMMMICTANTGIERPRKPQKEA